MEFVADHYSIRLILVLLHNSISKNNCTKDVERDGGYIQLLRSCKEDMDKVFDAMFKNQPDVDKLVPEGVFVDFTHAMRNYKDCLQVNTA